MLRANNRVILILAVLAISLLAAVDRQTPGQCVAPPANMVAWWPGDGSGEDLIGQNYGILMNGAAFGTGKVGSAFNLDGVNDYLNITSVDNSLRPTSAITLDAWIYPRDTGTDQHIISTAGSGPSPFGHDYYLRLVSNSIEFRINDDPLWAGGVIPSANQWYHIAATYDQSAGTRKIYINGALANSNGYSAAINTGHTHVTVGVNARVAAFGDSLATFNGMIDEAGVYNRALSAAEIQAIYNAGSAGKCKPVCIPPPTGILAWWPGDDNAGDIVGNSNGTPVGGATYAAGKVGRAFSFDGNDDYITIPHNVSQNPGAQITIDAWVMPTVLRTGATILQKRSPSNVGGFVFEPTGDDASALQFVLMINGTYYFATTPTGVLTAGVWQHLAATYDGSAMKIYVDGVEKAGTPRTGMIDAVTAPMVIGRNVVTQSMAWQGEIDEVELLNRALTQTEIQAIVNSGSNGKCHLCSQPPPDLLSWWPGNLNGFDIISGYNFTLYGDTSYAGGKSGEGFRFDGAGDYVRANNTNVINGGSQATYEAWAYPTATAAVPGEYLAIMVVGDSTIPHWTSQQCRLLYWRAPESPAGTSRFYMDCGLDNNDNYSSRMSSRDYPINTWHHVAGTFNSGVLDLYVDGVQDNGAITGTGGLNINTVSEHYVCLGALVRADSSVVTTAFSGVIDDARIYARALTADEILDNYNAGESGCCTPDRGKAYVPNGGSGDLSVIEIGSGTVRSTIAAPQQFGFAAIKNDGSKAYISGAALSKVTVIDTATNAVLTEFSLPGATHGLAVDITGTKLYVAQEFGSNIWVLNADSGALLATIPMGTNAFGVAVAPDGRHIYTANYQSGTMSAIRTSDYAVETITTGSVPYGIAVTPDSSKVYVANAGSNSVSVIDAATSTIVNTISFSCPTGIAVNRSGTHVYAGSCSGNKILDIKTSDHSSREIPVGTATEGVSVSPDESRVLAAAKTANAVLSINVATDTVTTIPVGTAPSAIGLFIAQNLPLPPAPPTLSCAPRPGGIASWWRGEGATLDQRKANLGSLAGGATYSAGQVGRSFSLDGVDDHVVVPAFDMGTDWTAEGWFNPAACTDSAFNCPLFTRSNGNQDGILVAYFGAGHPLAGQFAFDIGNQTSWQLTLYSGTTYSIGSWYHVAATKSGDTYTLYVNGAKRAQQTLAGVSTQYQSRDIVLGKWTHSTTAYLRGKIDEVGVYKRALTPAEIWSIYSADSYGKCVGTQTMADMDGDMLSDLAIFRPSGASGAEWWWLKSTGGNGAVQFGAATDTVVTADYTGDGKTDVAFWRPSTGEWYILRSEDYSFYAFPFGSSSDVPVPADYDGDGRADAAVFRASNTTWYISRSTGGTGITQFGAAGDKPVVEDYDGDGKADIAVFRPNGTGGAEWWIAQSSGGVFATQFGQPTDKAVPADYTGDGRADIAFWMPSNGFWYVLRSDDYSYYAFPFGASGDLPVPADYDGDAKTDAAVYRPATANWFISRSKDGLLIRQFGSAGDVPVPNAFVR